MTPADDASGRHERDLARALVAALPPSASPAMRLGAIDLVPVAEHLIYTAHRQPAADATRPSLARSLARIARAMITAGVRSDGRTSSNRRVAVFVTRPVHATLYEPVGRILSEGGVDSVVVDAESRSSAEPIGAADLRLLEHLRRVDVPLLAAHATAVHARLQAAPEAWSTRIGEGRAHELLEVLRRGLPLAALDVARIGAVLEHVRPSVAVCFSESGLLARTVPAAAYLRDIPSIDLPHAEAADPWGVAGAGYDGFAVYGPRSRAALDAAGIAPERIVEIGPLRYDALLGRPRAHPHDNPRRVVFASQPSDPRKPAMHPDVKRAALSAAVAAMEALEPAELLVIPHPTEPAGEAERFVTELGARATVERHRGLHDVLHGAFLLVTASSQSVFEAVLSGVPAMTVNPTEHPDPVTFAEEGIAIGVKTDAEAAAVATTLLSPSTREDAVARARAALGDRIGPLDGHAAERAAAWVRSVATAAARDGESRARR